MRYLEGFYLLARRLRSGVRLVDKPSMTRCYTNDGFGRHTLNRFPFRVTALKHVEIRPEVEGSEPLNTQPNGKRTAIGVFVRSVSKYSNGRIQWNTSWPRITFISLYQYHFRGINSTCGYRTSNDSKSIFRFQHLILPSHTAWLQKTGKSHPNEPVSTSARPFACQWFYVSTALGTSKVFRSLGTSVNTEVWPPSLRRTESGGITFQGINQTSKPGRNRETVGEAVEKSTSQWSLDANATAAKNGGLWGLRSNGRCLLSVSGTLTSSFRSDFSSNWGKITFFSPDNNDVLQFNLRPLV